MNNADYRARLLELERELVGRVRTERDVGAAPVDERADPGDLSQADEIKDTHLSVAGADSRVLAEVRAALGRIESGTYGRCEVDGKPIEEKRLAAVPWTRYCLEHQQEREPELPDTRAL